MKKHDFDQDFDKAFHEKKMSDFENWFCDMAELVWGIDFERLKAGGKHGDKKCDGRIASKERVFQCYAPESPANFAKNSPNKASDSFPDIISYWPNLKEWVFVHNNPGIPSGLSDTLQELRNTYGKIAIAEGSRSFIKSELHDKLSIQQLVYIYPSSPALRFSRVTMDEIRPLLRSIIDKATVAPTRTEFGSIPNEDKLDFNALDEFAKSDIRQALVQANLVERFLKSLSVPSGNLVIQTGLIEKYTELRGLGHSADEILAKLLEWVGDDGTPRVRNAAYVIVAYYFESCDIFENSPVSPA